MPTDPISVKQARRPKQKEQHAPHHEAGEIRVGPAGWSYDDWRGVVYPAHATGANFTKREYLAQFFDTIEINTSFYQPLRPDYAEQWIGRVAANPRFQFTAKLWQRFTHEGGGNAEDERIVRAGFDPLVRAGKLGAVLMQFPFSFHNTPENTAYLKKLIDRFADYSLVVEVRHATWNDKEILRDAARARRGLLQYRSAGHRPFDGAYGTDDESDRVRAAAWAPLRHVVHATIPQSPPEERYNYLYSAKRNSRRGRRA